MQRAFLERHHYQGVGKSGGQISKSASILYQVVKHPDSRKKLLWLKQYPSLCGISEGWGRQSEALGIRD